ncbi:Mur ligase [Mariannaea sp. PMI_226]|nr:Mur ligase [Mariannaea sp. PMI_226]
MSKTYEEVVDLLRSRSRPWTLKEKRPLKNQPNNGRMKEWLSELGHENFSDLNVIHITGTKGKGSTAAFTESLIRAHFRHISHPIKVGLYTSPHVITERDRIRINFDPVSEELFTKEFTSVWDTLRANVADEGDMPGYLQLLALTSVQIFMKEKVDVAIYEVHAGGRRDATNIFDQPIACGFTTIGLDHADLLGNTIESIAWHKSGIMKGKRPAFSIVQEEPDAREVLAREAATLDCPLEFVDIDEQLPDIPKLLPTVQKRNASLAIRLANSYICRSSPSGLTTKDITVGLGQCEWPGRFQTIRNGRNHWFLDSAHNSISLPVALSWFASEIQATDSADQTGNRRVLIFGHESKRDTQELIMIISRFCDDQNFKFDEVILSPYKRYGLQMHDAVIEEHLKVWQAMQPSIKLKRASCLEDAIATTERQDVVGVQQTLITGSTYLVGEALALFQDR